MERISKAQIKSLVAQVGKKYRIPTKPEYVKNRKQGNNLYKRDWLSADYNSIYGGYVLMIVKKETGGEDYFDHSMSYRQSTKEFYSYLKGLLR